MQHEIVASLEGARITIADRYCELAEYDFGKDCWKTKQRASWPLSKEQARQWVQGWNKVDAFRAFNVLVGTETD